jgi:hypothetical protein
MKYKLRNDQIVMLEQLKGKMLMSSSSQNIGIYCITDYKITEEQERKERIFREDKMVTVKYLTEIKMLAFHHEGRFLSSLTDDCVERYLDCFNLYYFRQVWVDFQEQLKAFDFKIVEIDAPKSE